jgi:antibiotic biosynthesis monooxygenase (ABM) superfamily enzyme
VTAILVKVRLHGAAEAPFFDWQARFAQAVAAAPGFIGVEFVPLVESRLDWRIVLQFAQPEHLEAWRRSSAARTLIYELHGLLTEEGEHLFAEEEAADFHGHGSVTEVITSLVRPGQEQGFRTWSARIQAAQSAFPGYRGTYIQAPTGQQLHWTTLVRFASAREMDVWLASQERRRLLVDGDRSVQSWKNHRLPNSFAGWFPGEADMAPPNWKQAMVVLLALFPVVMAELRWLGPMLGDLKQALATFIGNALSVALLTWLLMPLMVRALHWWLVPAPAQARWIVPAGTVLILGLYAVEITLWWHLPTP